MNRNCRYLHPDPRTCHCTHRHWCQDSHILRRLWSVGRREDRVFRLWGHILSGKHRRCHMHRSLWHLPLNQGMRRYKLHRGCCLCRMADTFQPCKSHPCCMVGHSCHSGQCWFGCLYKWEYCFLRPSKASSLLLCRLLYRHIQNCYKLRHLRSRCCSGIGH